MQLSPEKRNDILNLAVLESMQKAPPTKKGPRIPRVFDRKPELKKKVEDYLDNIPPEKKKEDMEKFEKFVSGEMTWAEIKGYPKSLLKGLARAAYNKFKTGDYQKAESLFKGLSIIDHTNWYYRAALGAIYQKQKLYDQAIEEFNIALSLNENEISALTNRGECFLSMENYAQALQDFEAVLALDKDQKNSWSKRAGVLKNRILEAGHGESLEE